MVYALLYHNGVILLDRITLGNEQECTCGKCVVLSESNDT